MTMMVLNCENKCVPVFRRNHSCSASDSAHSHTLLRSVVCLSVCRLSHSFPLLKPFDGFRCHLSVTPVGTNDTLCWMGVPDRPEEGGIWGVELSIDSDLRKYDL